MTVESSTLIIDAQVLQTDTWHRGIGKYSFELLAHACASLPYDRTVLLMNAQTPLSKDRRDAIAFRLPEVEIVYAALKCPYETGILAARRANGPILDTLLADLGVAGADYLILAPFPGGMNFESVFPTSAAGRRMCVVYDLIPLLLHQNYLTTEENRRAYLVNYRTVHQADLIFTISQTVADDLAVHLGIPPDRLVNIGGAAIGRRNTEPAPPDLPGVGRYVLMPTGQDHRKNNVRGVQGFEMVRQEAQIPLSLVLTSRYTLAARTALMEHSEGLVFVGNVSEAEMAWLYRNAEAVLFPSEIEGLGLPVLEGVEADVPVVCSDISAFREMSADAFYYFDPRSPSDMARALREALHATSAEREARNAHYPEIIERFSWTHTAALLSRALSDPRRGRGSRARVVERPRIAVLGPNPQGHSAIGKVIQELHPAMAERFDVDYYLEMPLSSRRVRPSYFSRVARAFDVERFNAGRHAKYDGVFYHLGNSQFHVATARNALHLPGIAIVHDTFLPYLFDAMVAQDVITPERRDAEYRLHSSLGADRSSCLASLVNNQLGVVVHSAFAKDAVQQVALRPVPCQVLGLPVGVPQLPSHFRNGRVRIGLAGILAEIKGLSIIRRLAMDERFAGVQFDVFGHGDPKHPHLLSLQVFPNVAVTTNGSDYEFQQLLSKLDILVSYRAGYRGETSLSVLEAMRHGVVNVVRGGLGWFEELPSDGVVKVGSEKELGDQLAELVADMDRRAVIGSRARDFVSAHNSHQLYAARLSQLLSEKSSVSLVQSTAPRLPRAVVGKNLVLGVRRFRAKPAEAGRPVQAFESRIGAAATDSEAEPLGISDLRQTVPRDIRRGKSRVRRSRACSAADFESDWLSRWAMRMGAAEIEPFRRSLWESCEILQSAEDAGALRAGQRAGGFGVRESPVRGALANLGLKCAALEASAESDAHRDRDSFGSPRRFDLIWSAGVMAHLGSAEDGLEFVRRSLDLLRPGGVAVHTTELELRPRTIPHDYGHVVVYTPEALREFLRSLGRGYSFDATFRVPLAAAADCHIASQPYSRDLPQLKVTFGESIVTSFALAIVKDPED